MNELENNKSDDQCRLASVADDASDDVRPNGRNVRIARVMKHRVWAGPLPPAEELEKFKNLLPDAPERIFAQWEQESDHRRNFENKALDANISDAKRGRDAAAAFLFLTILLTAFALWLGHQWFASIFGSTTILSVVGAFLKQRSYELSNQSNQKLQEEE